MSGLSDLEGIFQPKGFCDRTLQTDRVSTCLRSLQYFTAVMFRFGHIKFTCLYVPSFRGILLPWGLRQLFTITLRRGIVSAEHRADTHTYNHHLHKIQHFSEHILLLSLLLGPFQ